MSYHIANELSRIEELITACKNNHSNLIKHLNICTINVLMESKNQMNEVHACKIQKLKNIKFMSRTIMDLICNLFFISFKDIDFAEWKWIFKEKKPLVRSL